MSEEEILGATPQSQMEGADLDSESDPTLAFQQDFEQNGLLLKIATNGIAVQDYVKRLKESDILVAIDGEVFLDGPAKLIEKFSLEAGDSPKWLLTFWRDGELFDILLTAPIQSQFGLATEQETEWALEQFSKHVFAEFSDYENFEIYRDTQGVGDILTFQKDPLAFILPVMWCLKFRLFPPLGALLVAYIITFFINIILFLVTYLILSRFVFSSQANILRSFTLYAGKSHYMTIAATNEKDVSVIVKNIDRKNKIRFETNSIKPSKQNVIHKVIVNKGPAKE